MGILPLPGGDVAGRFSYGSFDTLNNLVVACLTEAAIVSHLDRGRLGEPGGLCN
jgi:hypothetical protein